ncbi:MAG: hypothetical protein KatS3mg003_0640 [Candidatus Nitrosocaldaceae archaeon]|nr:MAG: hypothetical protein KatS3mg003_0640 [Candidatus Nitrosocaldaceae archaeon]
MELVELANKDAREIKHMIIDHLNLMDEQGYARGYQESMLKVIKSWLRFNDISIDIPFKYGDTRLAKIQKLPDEDDYTDIINRADLRARAIIALISKSGIRPQVIGNADGTDGLRLKDIPDIAIINGKAICKQYPCMIKVRVELSKNRRPYITFLSKQGVKYLLTYLNDRIRNNEVLIDDSPVIAWDNKHRYGYPKHRKTRLLNTRGVSKVVREAIKGYNIRPYDLRHWFATRLEIAVAKGKISSSVKEALMGHISGIEHHYTYAKYNLAEPLINELRDAYARAEEFLDLEVSNKDKEEEELKNKAHSIIEQLGKEELLNLLANASRSNNSSK